MGQLTQLFQQCETMNQLPEPNHLFSALDSTWAPFAFAQVGPFLLRNGRGGGQRVSAASLNGNAFTQDDIVRAEAGMAGLGQNALFQVRKSDTDLDHALQDRGYEIVDPVILFVAKTQDLGALDQRRETVLAGPIALEMMAKIWAEGGIARARIDVMDRVTCPKRYLMLRYDNHGRGAGFVAVDGDIGMLHALEVSPLARRQGIGRTATAFAGQWAQQQGATWLALATVRSNTPACRLYESMGFVEATSYHYRRAKPS